MFARSLILGIVLITVAAAAQNNPPSKHDFTQLHRLSKALENCNFLESRCNNMITVWRQVGGKGISTTGDDDEETLTRAIDGIDGRDMDLSSVAVISDNGRNIRFIDYRNHQEQKMPEIKLKRGDVVALMLPQ